MVLDSVKIIYQIAEADIYISQVVVSGIHDHLVLSGCQVDQLPKNIPYAWAV